MEVLQGYLVIVASTAVVYLFVVIALKVFGKTEIAQLSVVDLVFIMLLGNAVQNAMVGSDTTLAGGLVAATTLFVMNLAFKQLLYYVPGFARLVSGGPITLVRDGVVNERNLKRSLLTHDELDESLREHGIEHVEDVDYAILETDGNISVMSKQFEATTSRSRRVPRRRTRKD
ncbi:MAG: DUF421 domain-containing protein [Atopobiaceae bacterium]|jgi:uncharacterized membrane protein YcaP (DUF421 family)|nr:DUF421 domain-containing protein [Atopobiaceae bacterium]MCH4179860.1 DUF421 domain-containing protein [Atopobiaceae bacterium]MCH4213611.1 DUF421 domain-containing protein [Atopobiaceae bacterium]MCH4229616.1 DUF421 domain-containing protein [Atopobiaceae bacterium]MCH4276259.1 DUF421 domain-containing protein [Atopobiaceae bacterium]